MERPNTVAGLVEKRRELVARLNVAKTEIKSLTVGIDAVDIVLKLFAPEVNGADAKRKRLPTYHAASKGEMRKAALDLLRETGGPITSRMVAERFCQTRGLHPDDATFTNIRNRACNAMNNLYRKRIVRQVEQEGPSVGWMQAETSDGDSDV